MNVITYGVTPTTGQFHAGPEPVRVLLGPIGSGKSVACCMELFRRSMEQAPDKFGKRRTKWAVVRNTYRQLESTTIATWREWVPGKIVFGSPIRHELVLPLPDGTVVEMTTLFMPLDRPGDVGNILSLEVTGVWINEARELPIQIVTDIKSRKGRYPLKRDAVDPERAITWDGIIMDSNMPDDDHWIHKFDMVERPDGWGFYRQPGAMIGTRSDDGKWTYARNPLAENVEHQPLGWRYWEDAISGASRDWIKVYVCGEYGSTFNGRPVYEEAFSERIHCSDKPLEVIKGLPLYFGADFGLSPAMVAAQMTPGGQIRVLREFVGEHVGIRQLIEEQVVPELMRGFPHGLERRVTGDPAGSAGAQTDVLQTPIGVLSKMGFPCRPASTNDITPRRDAVMNQLRRLVDKGEPGMIIDPSCTLLRKGFLGGYMFERVAVTGEERFKELPKKNNYSHVHDALQYMVLGMLRWAGSPLAPVRKGRLGSRRSPNDSWRGFV